MRSLTGTASAIVAVLSLYSVGVASDVETLVAACKKGDKKAVTAASSKCDVNQRTKAGQLALVTAAADARRGEFVALLLDHGADPNLATSDGVTALMAAAAHGNVETITMLLDHGASANLAGARHMTPLMLAAAGGYNEAATTLLAHGANRDEEDATHRVAARYAANAKHWDTVALVKLQVEPTYRACVDEVFAVITSGSHLTAHWDAQTGEHSIEIGERTRFAAQGLPSWTTSITDDLTEHRYKLRELLTSKCGGLGTK